MGRFAARHVCRARVRDVDKRVRQGVGMRWRGGRPCASGGAHREQHRATGDHSRAVLGRTGDGRASERLRGETEGEVWGLYLVSIYCRSSPPTVSSCGEYVERGAGGAITVIAAAPLLGVSAGRVEPCCMRVSCSYTTYTLHSTHSEPDSGLKLRSCTY